MSNYVLQRTSEWVKILFCLLLSVVSFYSYNDGDISNSNYFQDYFLFLLTEDPLIIFRCIYIYYFNRFARILNIESTLDSTFKHSADYYQWLYLFTVDSDFIFESLLAALWPSKMRFSKDLGVHLS